MGFAQAIQAAVHAVLSALSFTPQGGTAAALRVYDHVPQADDSGDDAEYPFVTINEVTLVDASTDTEDGAEFVLKIGCWSRYRGNLEMQRLEAAVYNALNNAQASLGITAYTCVFLLFESSLVLDYPDGIARQTVLTYRGYLDQTE
jgi:hypothetical protein